MELKKSHALIIFTVFDLLGIGIAFYSYLDITQAIGGIDSGVDMIEFSNRAGFALVAGLMIPLLHILFIVEHFRPALTKKNMRFINKGVIIVLVITFIVGFRISRHTRSYVENAGYVNCYKASYHGTFSRYLAYTKNMEICEAEVNKKKTTRR